MSKKLYLIESVSVFRQRYVVEAKDETDAVDEAIANISSYNEDWKEFSQQFVGEMISSSREISNEEYIDLCYNVYLLCNGAPQFVEGGGGPDQAALNLLLSLKPYKDITLYTDHDDGWACQCGTTVDPTKINSFRPNLLSPEPVWKDGVMYNSKGDKYAILHQYNRVPMINDYIRKKYERSFDIQHDNWFVYKTN